MWRIVLVLGFGIWLRSEISWMEQCKEYRRITSRNSCRFKYQISKDAGIRILFWALCIGTLDYTNVPWYSYDDLGNGQVDPNLGHFSVEKDLAHVIIPAVKITQKKNPDLLFLLLLGFLLDGWKLREIYAGGELLEKWYSNYALRYIQEYEKHGISIYAITVKSEPGVDNSSLIINSLPLAPLIPFETCPLIKWSPFNKSDDSHSSKVESLVLKWSIDIQVTWDKW